MTFKDLQLGATFDFIGPERYNSYFKRCMKVGKRVYRSIEPEDTDPVLMHVGSISVEVFHVEQPSKPFTPNHSLKRFFPPL